MNRRIVAKPQKKECTMLEQLLKEILLSGGSDELAQLLRKTRREREIESLSHAAAGFMMMHASKGLPMPVGGNKIRCTFSVDDTFDQRGVFYAPKEGRVYNVVASSKDENTRQGIVDFMTKNEFLEVLVDGMKNDAAALPCHIVIEDPLTGEQSLSTYPAFGGVSWIEADDDAIDQPNDLLLNVGDFITPVRRSAIGQDFTLGESYAVKDKRNACSCDKPECPANGTIIYTVVDGVGDELVMQFPFSPYGEFRLA
jgi:hypothetical protein